MDTKRCRGCGLEKPLSEFTATPKRADGYYSTCKACKAERWRQRYAADPEFRERVKARARDQGKAHPERHRDWARRNPDKVKAQKRRAYLRQKSRERTLRYKKKHPHKIRAAYLNCTYGITQEFYLELLSKQDGRCAICRKTPEELGQRVLQVDHSHTTLQVRGLLCRACNLGLGYFQDNLDLLVSAVSYRQEYH